MAVLQSLAKRIDPLLEKLDDIDYQKLQKVLREEGILIRLREKDLTRAAAK